MINHSSVDEESSLVKNGAMTKPSGVAWVGEVPIHWETCRLKDLALKSGTGGTPLSASERAFSVDGPVWLRPSNIYNGKILGVVAKLSIEGVKDSPISTGNTLFVTGIGNIGRSVGIQGSASCNQQVNYFKLRNNVNLSWMTYVAQSMSTEWINNSTATTLPICNRSRMESVSLPLPPLPEQIGIADYLDKTTALIDKQRALLARKKALLQEHKRALIHEAVTKGLNPCVPMKASGVDWIGDVPTQWITCRAKEFLTERSQRSADGSEVLLAVSAYYGVKARKDVIDEGVDVSRAESLIGYKISYKCDLVVNTMLAWNGSMGLAKQYGIVSPAYAVYCINALRAEPKYVEFLMKSTSTLGVIRSVSRGINDARLRLYPDRLSLLEFVLPPKIEQISISCFLEHASNYIDKQSSLIEKKIELLGKLREAIIHEAVTKGVPN